MIFPHHHFTHHITIIIKDHYIVVREIIITEIIQYFVYILINYKYYDKKKQMALNINMKKGCSISHVNVRSLFKNMTILGA